MNPHTFRSALSGLDTEIRQQHKKLQTQLQQQHKEQLTFLLNQRPSPSLPDPEKFAGQTYLFPTWLPAIKAKLRVDGEAIGDAEAQFYYVYFNLESHVQAEVLDQVHAAEKSQSWIYTTILRRLSDIYINKDTEEERSYKLLGIRQEPSGKKIDSIATYTARFERAIYEAQLQDLPDAIKISRYREGLSDGSAYDLRQAERANKVLPQEYPEFVRSVTRLIGSPPSTYNLPSPTIFSSREISARNETTDDLPATSKAADDISAIGEAANNGGIKYDFHLGSNTPRV